jgi:hypothetical protein
VKKEILPKKNYFCGHHKEEEQEQEEQEQAEQEQEQEEQEEQEQEEGDLPTYTTYVKNICKDRASEDEDWEKRLLWKPKSAIHDWIRKKKKREEKII